MGWVRRFILFHNKRHPQEMGKSDIECYLTYLANDCGVSASTHHQALSALLFLYKEVLGVALPWLDEVSRPNRSKRLPVVLSANEVLAVLAHLEGVHHLMVRLLYGTGLRLHEMLMLRIKDVDFEMNQLVVRSGKGDKDRLVGLADETIRLIDSYIVNERKDGCEYLFVGNRGNKMDGKNTSAMLKVCARKASIENWEELHISNHTMRRTFATMMSEADVPIEVISKAMGHSGIQITSRYVKRTEQRAVNAMSVVNF